MLPFARVPTDIWLYPSVRKAGLDYKALYAFYYAHPSQGLEGFSRCSDLYVTDIMGIPKAKVSKLRRQLMDDGLIHYDEETEEMYIANFLVLNPIKGPPNAVSVKKNLDRIRSHKIRAAILEDIGEDNLHALLEKHAEDQARKAMQQQMKREGSAATFGSFGGNPDQWASPHLQRQMKSRP
ncbi:hypothetical protein OHI65_08555 [Brucella sp. MAB-22]|uniref:hypothetical protein n=1 Tax=Brucella TaxID=234 RepID=UPI000F6802BC|nr:MULTISPECIES: hypothetical protein [Brucella]RRY16437.1 hypothetical protein EGJ57_21270 [Brucella anthropi]UYT54413.1 hypothetical protein OHI65_08555 [Brucella sp. MAB-22]